ncbi:MAG: hypothetical protein AAB739_00580 [Patescibacteria group bacterium]
MIGENHRSVPENRCTCYGGRKSKELKRESAEQAQGRLVKEITSAITHTISKVFKNRGNHLLVNVCGTSFNVSERPVSARIRRQAIKEALEKIEADVERLVADIKADRSDVQQPFCPILK